MRWIFGIIGLIVGAAVGGVMGAFLGALIGVGLAAVILHLDQRASSRWAHPDADAPPDAGTQPGVLPVTERVARLEHEVALGCMVFLLAGQIFAWLYPAAYGSA
ncbi:DUF2339 domain-containing protein, partial [Ralstonia pseudosolanacearum]